MLLTVNNTLTYYSVMNSTGLIGINIIFFLSLFVSLSL